jgi:integrase
LRTIRFNEGNVSRGTIDREYAVINRILQVAYEDWRWLERPLKIKLYRAKPKERKIPSEAEFWQLYKELPQHHKAPALFCITTGVRMGAALNLQWQHVDLESRLAIIPGMHQKNGEPLRVVLPGELCAMLRSLKGQCTTHVFSYKGKPIKQINGRAFRKARKRSGVDVNWHSFRHAWATRSLQNGTPPKVLQELGGWKTPGMIDKYTHLSSDYKDQFADNGLLEDMPIPDARNNQDGGA